MAKKDLNDYIKASHIKAVEKFNEELNAFARETGESPVTLYENPNVSFTLANITVENGWLKFDYDGEPDSIAVVVKDMFDGEIYESEYDGIMDYIRFWRKCLKRAQRYWTMDTERLDRIQDGEEEDDEEDDD
ncbi:MAG: hypothetical protein K6A96_10905 [Prevotella sp.]|nr:hypothetical protein [Prevotella sp.]